MIVFPPKPGDLAAPLMGEARERQRRRRLQLVGIIAVAAVVTVIVYVTSREWGVPFAGWHTTNGDLIRRDVRAANVDFDNALADGGYARACNEARATRAVSPSRRVRSTRASPVVVKR